MPLLLRIDNADSLPDGGPVTVELDRRGIDIGRDPYLDWTLPDPDRFISGKHCELRYRDGGYWLHDVSTNGTTVNGRPGRLTEPYRLQDGDRVHIGHYIIAVGLAGEDAAPPVPGARAGKGLGAGNVWGDVTDAAAAVDRRDFAARARSAADPAAPQGPAELPEEDISWSIGELTPGAEPPGDPWSASPAGRDIRSGGAWGWEPPDAAGHAALPADQRHPASPRAAPGPAGGAPRETPPPPRSAVEEPLPAADVPGPGEAGQGRPAAIDLFAAPGVQAPLARSGGAAGTAPGGAVSPAPVSADAIPTHTDPFAPAEAPLFEAPPAELPPVKAPAPDAPQAGAQTAEPSAGTGAAPLDTSSAGASLAPSGLAGQWTGGVSRSTRQTPTPTGAPAPAGGAFVAAFERGAGLPAGAVANRSDEAFAEELGALLRLVAQQLQAMLLARAETKSAMRSADRTMISALENNPLKFSPTPEDALRIMFGARSRSYLDARATVEDSFGDLQRHQLQTFGAMQAVLQALMDDLDPKAIEAATPEEGGLAGIVGSRRSRLWDAYVERFRAKSGRHERGMIDAFMILFAEMYDRQG